MIIGTLRVRLLLRQARSLKDKRQVVRSIKDRLHNTSTFRSSRSKRRTTGSSPCWDWPWPAPRAHDVKIALAKIVEALRVHPVAELVDSEMDTTRRELMSGQRCHSHAARVVDRAPK